MAKPGTTKTAKENTAAKPSARRAAPRALGKPFACAADGATMVRTVLAYEQGRFHPQQSADEEFGTTGYTWAAVEIKACLKNGVDDAEDSGGVTGPASVTRYPSCARGFRVPSSRPPPEHRPSQRSLSPRKR
ncbi:hypothetical protein GCM10023084_74620 [Streptomyces lacrimifluminis]|uniref:Uncharacterized protein n=1 Tax=Streptomyces lacrimifluminis TaxID=1500077 RepID=A0A917P7G7_9ACTN|nr:hypothetical protein GCM10012282_72690 [Streptomyces lacrimifluminis]